MTIGDNIRLQLKLKNISVPELQKLTGLPNAVLKNVIYNRSKKLEHINVIAKALNVPIKSIANDTSPNTLDPSIYSTAVKIVCDIMKEMQITATGNKISEYSFFLYDFIKRNKSMSLENYESYCRGMLENALHFGILHSKKDLFF